MMQLSDEFVALHLDFTARRRDLKFEPARYRAGSRETRMVLMNTAIDCKFREEEWEP